MNITHLEDVLNDTAISKPPPFAPEIWASRIVFNGIFGTVFEIFGILGNIMSIIVLLHYKQKSSTPLLLIFLAVFDTIYLCWEMMLEQLMLLSKARLITETYRTTMAPVYVLMFAVPKIGFTGSSIMTVLITIERWVAVVHPLRAARLCSRSLARKAIVLVFLWAVLFNLPRCLAFTYYYKWNNETNSNKLHFVRTEYGMGSLYNDVYISWITVTLEFLLPFLIIMVLNIHLIIAFRRSRSFATRVANDRKHHDGKLTIMVLAVTSMFFVCGVLYVSALIIVRRANKYSDIDAVSNNFIAVADTVMIINSALNFLVYCAVGKKFRSIFVNVFCCRKRSGLSAMKTANTSRTKSTSLGTGHECEM